MLAVVVVIAIAWGGLRFIDQREHAAIRHGLGAKHGMIAKDARWKEEAGYRKELFARANHADPRVRFQALQLMPDTPDTLAVFAAALQHKEPVIRSYAGYRLSGFEEAQAGTALDQAIARRDLAAVAGAWEYFTGPYATRDQQQTVADSFTEYGNEEMMNGLLNDRRPILSQGAAAFATKKGYMVIPR